MMDNNIIQICRLTLDEIEELHKIIKEKDKKIQALTDELETMKHTRIKSWDLGPGMSFGPDMDLSSLGPSVSTSINCSQSYVLNGEIKDFHTPLPDGSTQNTGQSCTSTSKLSEGEFTARTSNDSDW